MKNLKRHLVLAALIFSAFTVKSFALEPFDNWVNPTGLYGVVYPMQYSADELMDKNGNVFVNNLDFSQTGVVLRGVYYDTKPFSYLLSIYAPLLRVEAKSPATGQNESVSGLGDISLVGGWFFIDNRQKNLYIGLGLKIDLPSGDFDTSRAVAQLGEDVWRFRPLLSFAKLAGPFDVEAHLTYKMEGENSTTKEKDGNEIILESYAGMFLSQQWMVGAHFNAITAQNDELNGVETPDSADRVNQIGASVQHLFNPKASILFEYLQDFGVKNTLKGRLILVRGAYKF